MDVFNDSIDIFVKYDNNKILLSDDGETMRNLELNGVSISRLVKRKEMLNTILLNYGVKYLNGELIVEADEKSFAQKKLNLISAISETNDLYVLSSPTVESVFKEDVQNYLEEQNIVFSPHFISKGSVGLDFTFDFQIAYPHTEIVIKAFNTITRLNLPHFLFTWEDIQPVRERLSRKKVKAVAILNDTEKGIKGEFIDALKSKNADYFFWSERKHPDSIAKLKVASL